MVPRKASSRTTESNPLPYDVDEETLDPRDTDDHNDHMASTSRSTVGSRELKVHLGTYLRRVRAGALLVVTDRGRPIAELRPLPAREAGLEAKLESLAALGVISWKPRGPGLPKASRPLPVRSRALSRALADEREDRF